jgi:hypothetical protein
MTTPIPYYAAQRLLATTLDGITDRQPQFIFKTGDTVHNTETTVQNDPDFVFPMEADAKYEVHIMVASSGTDGDLKTKWFVPTSGWTGNKWCLGPTLTSTDRTDTNMRAASHSFTTEVAYGTAAAGASIMVWEVGVITTTIAGSFVWQSSQNTSTANDTTVHSSSYMRVTRIS